MLVDIEGMCGRWMASVSVLEIKLPLVSMNLFTSSSTKQTFHI